MAQQCFRPGGLDFTKRLISMAKLPKGVPILDAGCGSGGTVCFLEENGYDCWGIDRNPVEGLEKVICGDLQQLPFADSAFSAIISECAVSVCGNPAKALLEGNRVLQAGGRLLLADVYFHGNVLPIFFDERPLTLLQWHRLLQQCGFSILAEEDASASWKPFLLEQLWAGKTMEDIWGGCCPAEEKTHASKAEKTYQVGYFLLCAEKQPSDSFILK